jgi:hypothetical protein
VINRLRQSPGLAVPAAAPGLLTSAAMGRTPGRGAVSGSDYDPASHVVAGAEVVAAQQVTRSATTKADGERRIPLLLPGAWTVTVTANGFEVNQPLPVTVTASAVSSIRMQPAPASVQ